MTHHQPPAADPIDPVLLDRLADLTVRVGLNLQPGQDLLLTARPRRCRWSAGSRKRPTAPARGL